MLPWDIEQLVVYRADTLHIPKVTPYTVCMPETRVHLITLVKPTEMHDEHVLSGIIPYPCVDQRRSICRAIPTCARERLKSGNGETEFSLKSHKAVGIFYCGFVISAKRRID